MGHHLYVFGVVEPDGPVETLHGLRPPLGLLATIAVSLCGLAALEAGNQDAVALRGATTSRAEIPDRAGHQISLPDVESFVHSIGILGLAFDDLNEHDQPPWCGSQFGESSILLMPSIVKTLQHGPSRRTCNAGQPDRQGTVVAASVRPFVLTCAGTCRAFLVRRLRTALAARRRCFPRGGARPCA